MYSGAYYQEWTKDGTKEGKRQGGGGLFEYVNIELYQPNCSYLYETQCAHTLSWVYKHVYSFIRITGVENIDIIEQDLMITPCFPYLYIIVHKSMTECDMLE